MRSTILLTSAMAISVIAGPLNKRYIVTETDIEIETVTVYVTATAPAAPVATPEANKHGSKYHDHSRIHQSKSKPVVLPAPSSTVVPEPTSTYTPPPPPPTSTPEPEPAPAPTSVNVPEPAPTSVNVPEPAPTSQAPAPSAPSAPNQHPSGQIQETLSSGPDYEAAVLYHHNAARANHGAEPLVWDESCRANAQQNADRCDFKHYIPENSGQGQNLFTVSGDSFNVTAGITESWYKGEFAEMTNNDLWGKSNIPSEIFHSVGHLTQMLWKATTKVGCVSIDCGSRMKVGGNPSSMSKYTVCNYASAGNMADAYAENVGLPNSYNSLGSWSD